MSTRTNPQVTSPVEWTSLLAEFWTVLLPAWLRRRWPSASNLIADGGWLLEWPRLAAYLPLVAFIIGSVASLPLHQQRMPYIYSESLWFMAMVIAGSILSGTVGAMLLVGYICGDVFWEGMRQYHYSIYPTTAWSVVIYRMSRILGYSLLALPVCQLPQLARRLTREFLGTAFETRKTPPGWRAAVYSIACGGLIFLWCEGMTVLIRPVFTWMNRQPTIEAVAPVQQDWRWLVGAAIVAAVARVILEHTKLPSASLMPSIREGFTQAYSSRTLGVSDIRHKSPVIGLVLTALMVTFLLSGLYVEWVDALMVFFVTWFLVFWQAGRLWSLPATWIRLMQRIPALLRFGAVSLIGYYAASELIQKTWHFNSLRPVLTATVWTLVMYCLAFPRNMIDSPHRYSGTEKK